MAILSPDHLLDQANRLLAPPALGRPRQVDLRRAISSAYYAVFHAIITAAADEAIGAAQRQSAEYALVVRSIDHATIKMGCVELAKLPPPAKYAPYLPAGGFGMEARAFFAGFPGLQEQRHAADYDVLRLYRTSNARGIVSVAAATLAQLRAMPIGERCAIMFFLLFPPKR